jgi:uncharacterized protein (UPF0548 family)
MPIRATRPSGGQLADLVGRLRDRPLSYDEVGATAGRPLPTGYRHDEAAVELGRDAKVWASAQEALRTWQGHRFAEATITPAEAPLAVGVVVVATVRIGLIYVMAPCRIVYTTALDDRFGFAYGTLEGHPEQGEEAFHVARRADGTVWFEIVAFSRPAAPLARLGGPVARAIQTRTTRRYLAGVKTYVAGHQ